MPTVNLERVLTVLLTAGLAWVALAAAVFGGLTGMASDGCTPSTCNGPLIEIGVRISMYSPWVVFFGALIVVVLRWVRGRTTWWVPLAAIPVMIVLWFLGAGITESAVA